jgi:transmembrane sensor
MSMETGKQIEQRALEWLTKRQIGPWTEADQNELGNWLRSDTAHRVTFLRLEVGWERTARLKAFGVGNTTGQVPLSSEWRSSPFFERQLASAGHPTKTSAPRIAAVAAGVLLAAGVGFYARTLLTKKVYETPIGTTTSIPLSDGSSVTLNTQSKLRVALNEKERRIELEAGEAFFDVAKDPSRPFVVQAGERRIVAVGTRFSVRRNGPEVKVIVVEGKVRVEPGVAGGTAELLTAGAMVHTTQHSLLVSEKSVEEAEEALSWRSGYLTFDKTLLADAVAEFNRYTPQRIVIDDPKLAALRISGKFRATYAEDFVQLLRSGSGVEVRRTDETIHLTAN